ncbi:hypothetical protein [Kineococcus gypseus]|uniref:hypothetical protein n=1 Tax=Kineococcus gypseus TaxID=1637102 RepID=UPI003D7D7238
MTSGPDEPELDSAMATGNDEGEPGPATYPLHADGDDGAAVEGTAEAELAARDDAPLPASALGADGDAEDPLAPEFHEPGA